MSDRDYAGILERYVDDVLEGREVAGRLERLACERHRRDRVRDLEDPDCPFTWDPPVDPEDPDRGGFVEDVCAFVQLMPHVEGEWSSPTIVLEPWQIFILGSVFGWRRKVDGHRRFSRVYEEVARKNAKSAIASAVALYCLTCEGELGPQIKTAATTGSQARIVFRVAKAMADKTPAYREAYGVDTFTNSIACVPCDGSIQPINAKASTQDGLNPHLAVLDELHAHKDRALFDVLRSAMGARKNPLLWMVTTAGYNTEGPCFEQRTFAVKVLEGIFEADHFFAIVFTLDRDAENEADRDDEFDPRLWRKANPNLGVSVQVNELEAYAEEARLSPDTLTEFLTKRLNVWCSAKAAYLNIDRWKTQCEGPVDLAELEQYPCFGGLDLAAKTDIAALVLVWDIAGILHTWCRFYVPEDVVEPRTKRGNVPYQRWVRSGHLTATPGNVTDYAYIERDIKAADARFDLRELGFDPWNAYDITNRLQDDGIPMVEFRQGFGSYNAPMKELLGRVVGGRLRTGGDPVLRWMASNLVARRDVNENVAPDRKNSAEKIDGMTALLMGLGRSIVDENPVIEIPEGFEVVAV